MKIARWLASNREIKGEPAASSLAEDIRGWRPAVGRYAMTNSPAQMKTPGIAGRFACIADLDQAATVSATSLYSPIWSKFM